MAFLPEPAIVAAPKVKTSKAQQGKRRNGMQSRVLTTLVVLAGLTVSAAGVQRLRAAASPPVYVVTEVDVTDLDAYQKEYVPLAQTSIQAAGGRLLAAGQNAVGLDGSPPATRIAINQFESIGAVQAWRASPQFKEARKIGDKYAKFRSFAIQGLQQ
jgi:uncharacterized protein (DUF1330 family)